MAVKHGSLYYSSQSYGSLCKGVIVGSEVSIITKMSRSHIPNAAIIAYASNILQNYFYIHGFRHRHMLANWRLMGRTHNPTHDWGNLHILRPVREIVSRVISPGINGC